MIDRTESAEPANVLLVEPSAETARLASDGFGDGGSKTNLYVASHGDDALDFLHRRGEYDDVPRPCLVVLRYDLPETGPDGTAVLESMREATELERIPVVVTIESPTEDEVGEAYRLGANAVVPTPDDPDALAETMALVDRFWIATARLPNRDDRI